MLPPNWSKILEDIDGTLAQSIHLAQGREAVHSAISDEKALPSSAGDFALQLEELGNRAAKVEEPLSALDRALEADEEHVRRHLSGLEDLSHRLADWVGGAIK